MRIAAEKLHGLFTPLGINLMIQYKGENVTKVRDATLARSVEENDERGSGTADRPVEDGGTVTSTTRRVKSRVESGRVGKRREMANWSVRRLSRENESVGEKSQEREVS